MTKHTKRNTKTGKYDKTGITNIDLYNEYRFLQGVIKKITDIKLDVKRNVRPFYKFDELIDVIKEHQEIIKEKDRLKELS